MKFGVIGGGSWATALAKILTDNNYPIQWWIRDRFIIDHISQHHHNPRYLGSAKFDTTLLSMSDDIRTVVRNSDVLVVGVPSAYAEESLAILDASGLTGKKVVSAIKGLLP